MELGTNRRRGRAGQVEIPVKASVKRLVFLLFSACFITLGAHSGTALAEKAPLDPGSHVTSSFGNYLAGRIAGTAGDTVAAAEFYRKVLEDDPGNPFLLDQLLLLEIANGHFDDLHGVSEALLEQDSGNRIARAFLGLNSLRAREYTNVHRHMDAVDSGTLASLTATLISAWAFLGEGRTDEALARIDTLQGADWYKVFRDYMGGLIAEVGGLEEEAFRRLDAAYRAESSTLRIVEARVRHEARFGSRDEALTMIAAFEKSIPAHPVMVRLREEIESGAVIAPMIANAQQGAAEALYTISGILGRDGGGDSAIIYLRLALYTGGDNALQLVSLADKYEQQDQHERALEIYERIPADSPVKPESEIQRAINLHVLERSDEAIAILEGLIAENPQNVSAISTLGGVYRAKEQWQDAIVAYTKAIEQFGPDPDPIRWNFFYHRAIAYERSKQWPPAEADLLKALELYPDHPLVLNYLGYTWADQGVNLDEAFAMIERAVEQRPRDGYIVDSLGWAYYRLGDYESAVRYLERAVELRPDDPVINDHLGDAYWMVGRRLEAKFQWSHARDLDPDPEILELIEAKLKDGLPMKDSDRADANREDSGG